MKVFECDNCHTQKEVSSYTKVVDPLVLEYPKKNTYEFYGDGVKIFTTQEPKTVELCKDCAGTIRESYKHFLEEYVP